MTENGVLTDTHGNCDLRKGQAFGKAQLYYATPLL